MDISVNITTNNTPVQLEGGSQDVQNDQQQESSGVKNLTVSVLYDPDGEGGVDPIALDYPLTVPEDVDIEALEVQLEEVLLGQLQNMPLDASVAMSETLIMNDTMSQLASGMLEGGEQWIADNKDTLVNSFTQIESSAEQTIASLESMINSGKYPDHTAFLKLMLTVAQDIKEFAQEARLAAVEGEFTLMLEQAQNMFDAAEKNKAAADEEVKAMRAEAWASIATGIICIGVSIGGMSSSGAFATFAPGISQAVSSIGGGIGSLIAAGHKTQANVDRKEAEDLQAAIKNLEALAKLEQESGTIATELKEIANALRDFVLRMMQDFISNQYRVTQQANI